MGHLAFITAIIGHITCLIAATPSNASGIPVTSETLNYTAVAESTEDIRLYIMAGKPENGTDETYQHEYEVVHSKDTEYTAMNDPGTLLQYYQGYHYRDTISLPELADWNDTYAPFHIFGRPDNFLALLTPLARLAWNAETFAFDDSPSVNPNASIHVGLFLGDSSEGASHETIYRTMQIRRAYVESVLREKPALAEGLTNYVQAGKSLKIG
ncbi:hypothetical protein ColLi_07416 [Colletotrichum liriopes]|uniref:Uncharacterized protein n=1 Tax=Colletotrichum liriopes TaxID=708192 RepID=A0AA37GQW4_9PEZI|nr:hypothetical protein ColLi_07416 [Colletotrichum liriopes]